MLLVKAHGEVVGYLAACADNNPRRVLQFDDIHNTLECQFVEIQTVAHVIISGNGLGIIVYHNRAVALFADSVESLYTTPVELHRRTYAISS